MAVYPEIQKLETIIQNVRDGLRILKERDCHLVGQSVAWNMQQVAHIQIPPMLDRNIDRLFVLGDVAGPTCLQLVSGLLQYNTLVGDIAARVALMNAEQWVEAVGHLDGHLTLLDGVVAKCKHTVQSIHDSVKG